MWSNPATNSMPITRRTFTTPFSYRRGIFAVIVSLAMGGSAGLAQMTEQQALGNFYYGVREYNLITFGDYYGTGGNDTEGALAVGGDFKTTGSITYCQKFGPLDSDRSRSNDPSLIVMGNIVAHSETKVGLGSAYLQDSDFTWDATQRLYTSSSSGKISFLDSSAIAPASTNIPTGFNFKNLEASALDSQSYLRSIGTRNVSVGSDQTLKIAVNDGTVGYYSWDATRYTTGLELSIPEKSMLVINVDVSKLNTDSNGAYRMPQFNASKAGENRVLWNIYSSDTSTSTFNLSVWSQLNGSVLAPNANIFANEVIEGQILAQSYNQLGKEVHLALLTVDATVIPEPTTYAALLGAASLGFVFWRRRQQRPQHQV